MTSACSRVRKAESSVTSGDGQEVAHLRASWEGEGGTWMPAPLRLGCWAAVAPEQVGSQEVVFRLWIQPPWPTGLLRNLWDKSAAQGLGVCPPPVFEFELNAVCLGIFSSQSLTAPSWFDPRSPGGLPGDNFPSDAPWLDYHSSWLKEKIERLTFVYYSKTR